MAPLGALTGRTTRTARACDAFDNFPAGLTGKTLVLTGKLPLPMFGRFGRFGRQMRLRAIRRLRSRSAG